jgi:UDP-glucose 4-epimerase
MSHQKTILVTGVAGFIGRYVARLFVEEGWLVVGIDSSSPENAPLLGLTEYRSLRLPSGELPELLHNYAPDLCIHCAGRAAVAVSVHEPLADFYANMHCGGFRRNASLFFYLAQPCTVIR